MRSARASRDLNPGRPEERKREGKGTLRPAPLLSSPLPVLYESTLGRGAGFPRGSPPQRAWEKAKRVRILRFHIHKYMDMQPLPTCLPTYLWRPAVLFHFPWGSLLFRHKSAERALGQVIDGFPSRFVANFSSSALADATRDYAEPRREAPFSLLFASRPPSSQTSLLKGDNFRSTRTHLRHAQMAVPTFFFFFNFSPIP